MIGIDTNILLRWLIDGALVGGGTADQSVLIDDLIANSEEQIFVNHVVLIEVVWVLRRRARVSKEILITTLESILNSANIVIHERDLILLALESYSQYPGDFPDHLIGETNRQNGCRTTMTFDKAASKFPQFSVLQR
jgi:predicted nucleic-acid-binding protein